MTTATAGLRAENLKGAGVMVLSMALFSIEDAVIKHLSAHLPAGQILILFGGTAAPVLILIGLARRQGLPGRAVLHPIVLMRTLSEAVGTFGYILSLTLAPLALVSVILQASPLAVTMGAALLLGEATGWRRWSAVGVGFAGVVLAIAPWQADFQPAALWALIGVVGLSGRDLLTRRLPRSLSGLHVSILAFLVLLPTGGLLLLFTGASWAPLTPRDWLDVGGILVFGIAGYLTIVAATRIGELGFIAPFRYARIPFALTLAMIFFGERLGANMLVGGALIIGAGLYAFWREAHRAGPTGEVRRASQPPTTGL